jgi:hypothetical protein
VGWWLVAGGWWLVAGGAKRRIFWDRESAEGSKRLQPQLIG